MHMYHRDKNMERYNRPKKLQYRGRCRILLYCI